jgi:hypothetical protein
VLSEGEVVIVLLRVREAAAVAVAALSSDPPLSVSIAGGIEYMTGADMGGPSELRLHDKTTTTIKVQKL